MSFTQLLINRATVKRQSGTLYSGTITGNTTITISATLPTSGYVNLNVSSVTNTGNVSIVGSTTETFTITTPHVYVGEKTFTSISSIDITDFTGTLTVYCTTSSGAPIYIESTVYSNIPCRLITVTEREAMIQPGTVSVELKKLIYDSAYTLQLGDIVTIDSKNYKVTRIESFYDSMKLHHYEAVLEDLP